MKGKMSRSSELCRLKSWPLLGPKHEIYFKSHEWWSPSKMSHLHKVTQDKDKACSFHLCLWVAKISCNLMKKENNLSENGRRKKRNRTDLLIMSQKECQDGPCDVGMTILQTEAFWVVEGIVSPKKVRVQNKSFCPKQQTQERKNWSSSCWQESGSQEGQFCRVMGISQKAR